MSDELFLCRKCSHVAPLTTTLHCESCGSDNVVSTESITAAVTKHLITKHLTTILAETYYYRLEYQGFVTMVDCREAPDEKEAIELATHDCNLAWYMAPNSNMPPIYSRTERSDISVAKVTRSQYCDWLRSKY